jgi:hypothetical protein
VRSFETLEERAPGLLNPCTPFQICRFDGMEANEWDYIESKIEGLIKGSKLGGKRECCEIVVGSEGEGRSDATIFCFGCAQGTCTFDNV